MMIQKWHSIFLTIFLLVMIPISAKITGSIGNARMILYATQGDTINKCVLVKNVNDISVAIQVTVSGDLADFITLKDQKFTLQAREEKNTCFTISVDKEGTTETKINVMFSPIEEGNGVGLSSTIIVVAKKKEGFLERVFGNTNNSNENNYSEEPINGNNGNAQNNSRSLLIIISIITLVLFIILLVLMKYSSRKKKQLAFVPQTELPEKKSEFPLKKGGKIKK